MKDVHIYTSDLGPVRFGFAWGKVPSDEPRVLLRTRVKQLISRKQELPSVPKIELNLNNKVPYLKGIENE